MREDSDTITILASFLGPLSGLLRHWPRIGNIILIIHNIGALSACVWALRPQKPSDFFAQIKVITSGKETFLRLWNGTRPEWRHLRHVSDANRRARDWSMTSKAGACKAKWPSLRPPQTAVGRQKQPFTFPGGTLTPRVLTKRYTFTLLIELLSNRDRVCGFIQSKWCGNTVTVALTVAPVVGE